MSISLKLVTILGLAVTLKVAADPCPKGWENVALDSENWNVQWDGYGEVTFKDGTLTMRPKTPEGPEATHSALVLSKKSWRYFTAAITYVNKAPTRPKKEEVNSWEVLWLMFNYDLKEAKTNYFVGKTNGAELGIAYEENKQKIPGTTTWFWVNYGSSTLLTIQRTKDHFQATTGFNYFWRPIGPLMNDNPGPLGLYTEDAHVIIQSVCVLEDK